MRFTKSSICLHLNGCIQYTTIQLVRARPATHACFFAMECDLFCAATKSDSTAAGQRELNSKLVGPSSKAKNIQKFLYA